MEQALKRVGVEKITANFRREEATFVLPKTSNIKEAKRAIIGTSYTPGDAEILNLAKKVHTSDGTGNFLRSCHAGIHGTGYSYHHKYHIQSCRTGGEHQASPYHGERYEGLVFGLDNISNQDLDKRWSVEEAVTEEQLRCHVSVSTVVWDWILYQQ